MDWADVDWAALERLRDTFIGRAGADGSYWRSESDVASYDFTFGRRIAWKWAPVLESLAARGWTPPASRLVDWGCGTAIGARSVLAHFPDVAWEGVVLWDRSPVATGFAESAIRARRPGTPVRVADPETLAGESDGGFTLVVSHVLNELDTDGRAALLALARRAAAVLWLEPGTAADSRGLIAVREELRAGFGLVAPCPHDGACGMLAPGNERHWCHHFARPPTAAFTEAGWAQFSRRLGIDLRSLAYSYLVLDARGAPVRAEGESRVIGEPRQSGVTMKVLRCRADPDATGRDGRDGGDVAEVELVKRQAPALWRTLDKGRHDGLLAWREAGGRIEGGA